MISLRIENDFQRKVEDFWLLQQDLDGTCFGVE